MFGRTTYKLMKNYWLTPTALPMDRDMAQVMNIARATGREHDTIVGRMGGTLDEREDQPAALQA